MKDPDKPIEEWTEDELWEWNTRRAIEAVEKTIAFYRTRFKDQIVYNDNLLNPEDLKSPGPAKHVHLTHVTDEDEMCLKMLDEEKIKKPFCYFRWCLNGQFYNVAICHECGGRPKVDAGMLAGRISCQRCQTSATKDTIFEAITAWAKMQKEIWESKR